MTQNHKLILASRVEHTPVLNEDGWMIGRIKDLSIDRETGQVECGIVGFGGILGMGNKLLAIPWAELRYDPHHKGFVVSISEDDLRKAPHYDAYELEEFGGSHPEEKAAKVLDYYGRYAPPAF